MPLQIQGNICEEGEKTAFVFEGKVWKFGDNISTDLIMPGFAVLAYPGMTDEEASKYVMYSNKPEFAKGVKPGDIIVGGRNFGCGSSRPATGPLKALGVSCVVAESIARIFFRNSINLGFPVLNAPGIQEFCKEGDRLRVNVGTGEIKNVTTGKAMKVKPMAADSPPIQILKAGGLVPLLERELLKK